VSWRHRPRIARREAVWRSLPTLVVGTPEATPVAACSTVFDRVDVVAGTIVAENGTLASLSFALRFGHLVSLSEPAKLIDFPKIRRRAGDENGRTQRDG
jgi:hypothetical protein